MMGYLYGDSFGWGIWGPLMMVVFWIAVIMVIVWIVKSIGGAGGREDRSSKTALDILEERYAKGEIDKNEFEAKKKDLSH